MSEKGSAYVECIYLSVSLLWLLNSLPRAHTHTYTHTHPCEDFHRLDVLLSHLPQTSQQTPTPAVPTNPRMNPNLTPNLKTMSQPSNSHLKLSETSQMSTLRLPTGHACTEPCQSVGHLNHRWTLTRCQIVLFSMHDFPALVSSLPARF